MKTILIPAISAFLWSGTSVRAATIEVDMARSRIQVDAKATGHAFTGSLAKYTATVTGDPVSFKPTKFDLAWDFNDLDTGDKKRDAEMVKWLGGGKPKGTFSFAKSWEETAAGGKAQGALTVNGVANTVAFPYTVKRDDEWVTIDGTATLDYQAFKLPVIRKAMVMTVDPKLVVRFHIVGKLK